MIQDMAKNKPDPEVLKANRSVYGWMFLRRNLDKDDYKCACRLSSEANKDRVVSENRVWPKAITPLKMLGFLIPTEASRNEWYVNPAAFAGGGPEHLEQLFKDSHFTAACDDFHYEL